MAESISLVVHGSQSPCPLGRTSENSIERCERRNPRRKREERRGGVIDGFQRRETKKTNFTAKKESFPSSS